LICGNNMKLWQLYNEDMSIKNFFIRKLSYIILSKAI